MDDETSPASPGRRALLGVGAATLAAGALAGCTDDHHRPPPSNDAVATAVPRVARPTRGTHDGRVVDLIADFGAKGDGHTDDSDAFAAAYAYAVDHVQQGAGRTVVEVPPGAYLVTRPNALLDGRAEQVKANGLRFRGGGKRITEIFFRPAKADGAYLASNSDAWANLVFEGITFVSATPGASFFYSYSTGQAQDYRFSDCEWLGEWTYGLALDGSNCNSEMRWAACRVGGAYRRAFLYSGLGQRSKNPAQQDQFLNYWFTDMKVEYDWGNFLEFPYGGSITCRGGSYIITGRRPAAAHDYGLDSFLFRFPRRQHAASVQRFHAQDIRFEVRDEHAVVIDSRWGGGTIRFSDCDDTADAFKSFAAATRPHRFDLGARGPLVRYDSCQLSGRHLYRVRGSAALPPLARYDMCLLASHPHDDFVVTDGPSDGSSPAFSRFVDCLDP